MRWKSIYDMRSYVIKYVYCWTEQNIVVFVCILTRASKSLHVAIVIPAGVLQYVQRWSAPKGT